MNFFALTGLLTCISSLAFGIFWWFKGRKPLHRIWAIFNLATALWGFGAFKFSSTLDQDFVFLWLRIGHIGVILIPVLFLRFVVEFLEVKAKRLLTATYLLGALFLLLNLTDSIGLTRLFIIHLRFVFNSFYVDSPPGLIYPFFVIFFFGAVIYAHSLALRVFKTSSGIKRKQIQYFFLATTLGFAGGGTAFPMVFKIDIYPFLHCTVPLYPLIMTYPIIRYRLMDVNLAITRTMVFTAIYALVLGLPLLPALAWRPKLEQVFGINWWVWLWFICAVLATAAHYANQYFQRKAEGRLLAEEREILDTLLRASRDMPRIRNIQRLVRVIVSVLGSRMRVSPIAVYLADVKGTQYTLVSSRGYNPSPAEAALGGETPLVQYLQKRKEKGPAVREELSFQQRDGGGWPISGMLWAT